MEDAKELLPLLLANHNLVKLAIYSGKRVQTDTLPMGTTPLLLDLPPAVVFIVCCLFVVLTMF